MLIKKWCFNHPLDPEGPTSCMISIPGTFAVDQGSGSREDEDSMRFFGDVDGVKDAQMEVSMGKCGKVWENVGKIMGHMGNYGKIW